MKKMIKCMLAFFLVFNLIDFKILLALDTLNTDLLVEKNSIIDLTTKFCNGYGVGYAINQDYVATSSTIKSPNKKIEVDSCYINFEQAKEAADALPSEENKIATVYKFIETDDSTVDNANSNRVVYTKYGIINFNNANTNITYNIYDKPNGSVITYVNPGSQNDALYLGSYDENWAKIQIGGLTGYIKLQIDSKRYHQIMPLTYVNLANKTDGNVIFSGYMTTRWYRSFNNDYLMSYEVLRGYGQLNLQESGYAHSVNELTTKKIYYSYDQHYYYSSFIDLIDDLKNEVNTKSVNKDPYYNYYQYLPLRSKTTFTYGHFNQVLLNRKPDASVEVNVCYTASGKEVACSLEHAYSYTGPSSILYNSGEDFSKAQNKYGVNAALVYSLALLEGGSGTSALARAKFNTFGLGAVDSCAFECATTFTSVYDGIVNQFQNVFSKGYLNPSDFRYYGSHFGNKQSGVNVKYAADPNWGFKNANLYRQMDSYIGYVDYNFYQVGVTKNSSNIIYKNSTGTQIVSSQINSKTKKDYPFIVVAEVDNRYKILLDVPSNVNDGSFNYDEANYGYINKTDLYLINKPSNGYQDPANVANDGEEESFISKDVSGFVQALDQINIYGDFKDLDKVSAVGVSNSKYIASKLIKYQGIYFYYVLYQHDQIPRYGYVKAKDVVNIESLSVGHTNYWTINVRETPSTSATALGVVRPEGINVALLEKVSGTSVGGNTNWYKVIYDHANNKVGYISATCLENITKLPTLEALPIEQSNVEKISLHEAIKPKTNYMVYGTYDLNSNSIIKKGLNSELIALEKITTDDCISYRVIYGYENNQALIGYVDATLFEASDKTIVFTNKDQVYIKEDPSNIANDLIKIDQIQTSFLVVKKESDHYLVIYDLETNKTGYISSQDVTLVSESLKNTATSDQLEAYTGTNLLDYYSGSKVTKISYLNNKLLIEGYGFALGLNFDKANSFNRTLVLINAEKLDPVNAYKYEVRSTYKGLALTNDLTINPLRKFNYNYATYFLSLDLDQATNYANNSISALPKGTYKLYLKMESQGKVALIPLKANIALPSIITKDSNGQLLLVKK